MNAGKHAGKKPALVLAIFAAALIGLGGALGWSLRQPRLNVGLYAQNRLVAIQAHLDEAAAGYVLLAGDSQAELQSPAARLCGAEIVNAGISGAGTALYGELFARLSIPHRPAAVVLTIGTNDLNRKHEPRMPAAAERFEASLGRLVARLRAVSDVVVVTALPPIGAGVADRLDASAVADYSERIRRLCARDGCLTADPYRALRGGDAQGADGLARPDALRDGLHLARYRPVLAALEPVLCAATASTTPHPRSD